MSNLFRKASRVSARVLEADDSVCMSIPLGITWSLVLGTPQRDSLPATSSDTAIVARLNGSVAMYKPLTRSDVRRPSSSPSRSECSVVMTVLTPAKRAAIRPYNVARYRWTCTASGRWRRISLVNRASALSSWLERIPRS